VVTAKCFALCEKQLYNGFQEVYYSSHSGGGSTKSDTVSVPASHSYPAGFIWEKYWIKPDHPSSSVVGCVTSQCWRSTSFHEVHM